MMGAQSSREMDPDFWRCLKCGRMCTGLEMNRALGIEGTGTACTCGAIRYSPVNFRWYWWLLPRVWKFAYLRVRGAA